MLLQMDASFRYKKTSANKVVLSYFEVINFVFYDPIRMVFGGSLLRLSMPKLRLIFRKMVFQY